MITVIRHSVMKEQIIHPFEPIFDSESKVLILGTIPSPKSREIQFYYGHPQNRFWRILPDLFGKEKLISVPEKTEFLHETHIALWDVLASCEIEGADDSSIRKMIPNDLSRIISKATINAVFTNGQKASFVYKKFFLQKYNIPWIGLPSTSPANCRFWTYDSLKDAYRVILDYL